jgi:membrane protease YdiL (CAAX protease family)
MMFRSRTFNREISIQTLLISLAAVVPVELLAGYLVSRNFYPALVVVGAMRLLEIAVILLVILAWGGGLPSLGLARFQIGHGFKKGLLWSAGFGIFACLAFATLRFAGVDFLKLVQTRLPAKPGEIVLFFIVGGMVGPVAEEFLFRGILYGFFRRWGVVVALVLTTLIFVLAHPVNQTIPLTQIVGGLVFAVAYEVEGSLLVPIIIHVLGNMAIFAVSLVS